MNAPENMTLQATVGQGDKPPSVAPVRAVAEWLTWPGRIAVLSAVLSAPWMIGSVNPWPQRLIMFLLLIGVGLWWFESAVSQRKKQVVPYVAVPLILGLLIGFFQTFPLSDWLVDWFVGKQAEIYQRFIPGGQARPRISLDVEATLGQIRLMTMCLAALLLGGRYFRTPRDLQVLLAAVTINGTALAFFGIIQKLTFNGMIYWTIPLTEGGNPMGPFVNRNNGAGYLLLCLASAIGLCTLLMADRKTAGPVQMVSKEMPFWRQFYFHLLYFVAELTAVKTATLVAIVVIASGVIATASRGGGIAMIIGTIGTLVIYGMARKPKYTGFILLPLVGLIFALTGWIGLGDEFLNRVEGTDLVNYSQSELRLKNWSDTWPAVEEMGLLGSGLGSYASVHRLYRSDDEQKLFAHAENQFFQGIVEAGWPGLLLFCFAWFLLYQYSSVCLFRGSSPASIAIGSTAAFLLFSQVVASCFDFGLYIPANATLFALLVGFVAFHSQSLAGRLKHASWLRFEVPTIVVQFGLLAMFAVGFLTLLQSHQEVRQRDATLFPLENINHRDLTLAQTDRRIEDLTEIAKDRPTSKAMTYLGRLWVHRSRVQFLDAIKSESDFQARAGLMDKDQRETYEDNLWKLTSVPRMQEQAYFLERDISPFRARRFLSSDFIRSNLPQAREYFDFSRRRRPLQPLAHLEVGMIGGVLDYGRDVGDADIDRAIALAPSNSSYRLAAATYFLQAGKVQPAATHVRKYLELKPPRMKSSALKKALDLLTGRESRTVAPVSSRVIFEKVLPDDPAMLYAFAKEYLPVDAPIREQVLKKSDELVGDPQAGDLEKAQLKAKIRLLQGDVESAIEYLEMVLISRPNDVKTRYSVTILLHKSGKLEQAFEHASDLSRLAPRNRNYAKLYKQIGDEIRRRDNSRSFL